MLCDKRKDELEELTRDLVAQQSESGSEDGAAGVLKQYMLRHGFDEVTTDDSGSVIGRLSGSRPGPKVLFDGHLDTVPVANPAAWTHDPYGCEIVYLTVDGTADCQKIQTFPCIYQSLLF